MSTNKVNLRKVFVQLLFSLAIGQVALRCGNLVVAGAYPPDYYYSYLHLLLSVVIITSSWVGWHNSKSPHNSDSVESVFSLPYLILLVDIFLVICYFIIVNGSEVDSSLQKIASPSSHIEVLWSMIIFLIYLFWDLVTKSFEFKYSYNEITNKVDRKISTSKILFKRFWPTILCFVISVFIYLIMGNETEIRLVGIIDITLIGLFLSFRGLKQDVLKVNTMTFEDAPSEIKNNKSIIFPVDLEIGNLFYNIKFLSIKYLPLAIVFTGFVLYYLIK